MSNKIYTHCVDFGHGGTDSGAVGDHSHEADLVMAIGKKVGRILVERGQKVIYTRTTDVYLTLAQRANTANNNGCDTFTSIHANSFSDKSAHGIETFSYPKSSSGAGLSKLVQSELIKATGLTNRGCTTANFGVLRMTSMVAILVETAFISNPTEENLLLSNAYQEKVALAIVKGIFAYLGLNFSGETIVSNNPIISSGKHGIVTAYVLNVRLRANVNSSILGTLNKNEKVKIDNKVGNWYSIFYGNHGGFVSAGYIKLV
ncbi:N-acetylmuramoyl-L-alanine amidase [Clostridium sp. CM028]|uniref:N-acetylmuramoyl-L-alanine amidase n=1 Tax=unclassified Clostridium TaxID=2614128 RepID=UPI001C6E3911|nr:MULTISPECIES: N-acetylmuramoyl-L-alanine amidase [unclassified Clostridium]MBW9146853.1 N-acetylmuramoyl-L-alanine amidase [Clostridium sp. CM027]MBW9150228.1 N-acetylmuramoyl-L-alanine amidase [Clostridium sp. CM028]UVE42832.1 N-acetylmuramoyl-L-alanine amidase [Clostridium sp. CM027]WLC63478.1 N-acetylmuramoyl-L-alanine amidase [Clostridium sp. CM028]